jgi:hypothetical protein
MNGADIENQLSATLATTTNVKHVAQMVVALMRATREQTELLAKLVAAVDRVERRVASLEGRGA